MMGTAPRSPTHGGKHQSLRGHRLDVAPLGVHAAREEDDRQREHADELGILVAVEFKTQAVAAKQHARKKEQQQGGHAEAIAPLADDDARKDEHGSQEEDVFRCE